MIYKIQKCQLRLLADLITLKKSIKLKEYPCCSDTPEQTRLADAPTNVPFPPKQVANARAYTKGGRGSSKSKISHMNFNFDVLFLNIIARNSNVTIEKYLLKLQLSLVSSLW